MDSARSDAQTALSAIRMMILGSTDRANLDRHIEALVAFGLGEADVPLELVGWLSVGGERLERGE